MLKGRVIFITGASSGIGLACAKQFAAAGAKLILSARRLDLLHEIKVQLEQEFNVEAHLIQLDVRQYMDVRSKLNQLPEGWKNIDVLINNAGLAAGLDAIQEASVQDWEAMIDTNIKGLLYVTREILPNMVARNVGHIINIGSIAGHQVYPKASVYIATKHAVKALSSAMRVDLFGTKIRVSSVDPGAVETNFSLVRFKGDKKRSKAVYEGMKPLDSQDIASAVFYCASCPPHVNVSEMIIMPTDQASATMIFRESI
jgi:3-hydroxy acid dehydrogenase/malonic semialdehyde reductase